MSLRACRVSVVVALCVSVLGCERGPNREARAIMPITPVEDAAPDVEDTSSAVEDAAPDVEDAAPDREDAAPAAGLAPVAPPIEVSGETVSALAKATEHVSRASIEGSWALEDALALWRRVREIYLKRLELREQSREDWDRDMKEILETINWDPRYVGITLASEAETFAALEHLLVEIPSNPSYEAPKWGTTCHYDLAEMLAGPVVLARTKNLDIYIAQEWGGGRGGLMWTVCERGTDRLVRSPVNESGCSAGEFYRELKFREYVKGALPLVEGLEMGCHGDDPYTELLFHLDARMSDVPGAKLVMPNPYKLPSSSLYWERASPITYSWNARGELIKKRLMHVRLNREEEPSFSESICGDPERAAQYHCKRGKVPHPTWERSCVYHKDRREVTCREKLVSRAPFEGPIDNLITMLMEAGEDDYGAACLRAIERVPELREKGYIITDKDVRALQAEYDRYTGRSDGDP